MTRAFYPMHAPGGCPVYSKQKDKTNRSRDSVPRVAGEILERFGEARLYSKRTPTHIHAHKLGVHSLRSPALSVARSFRFARLAVCVACTRYDWFCVWLEEAPLSIGRGIAHQICCLRFWRRHGHSKTNRSRRAGSIVCFVGKYQN